MGDREGVRLGLGADGVWVPERVRDRVGRAVEEPEEVRMCVAVRLRLSVPEAEGRVRDPLAVPVVRVGCVALTDGDALADRDRDALRVGGAVREGVLDPEALPLPLRVKVVEGDREREGLGDVVDVLDGVA